MISHVPIQYIFLSETISSGNDGMGGVTSSCDPVLLPRGEQESNFQNAE